MRAYSSHQRREHLLRSPKYFLTRPCTHGRHGAPSGLTRGCEEGSLTSSVAPSASEGRASTKTEARRPPRLPSDQEPTNCALKRKARGLVGSKTATKRTRTTARNTQGAAERGAKKPEGFANENKRLEELVKSVYPKTSRVKEKVPSKPKTISGRFGGP